MKEYLDMTIDEKIEFDVVKSQEEVDPAIRGQHALRACQNIYHKRIRTFCLEYLPKPTFRFLANKYHCTCKVCRKIIPLGDVIAWSPDYEGLTVCRKCYDKAAESQTDLLDGLSKQPRKAAK